MAGRIRESGDSLVIAVATHQTLVDTHAAVTLLHNGVELAKAPPLGRLPLASLPSGSYTLTLAVAGGPVRVTRSAAFTVQ